MNTHTTIEKMRTMRMPTMASLYHQAITDHLFKDLSNDDFVSMLVDSEWEVRQKRRIANLIKGAGFKQNASATDIDYSASRGLDQADRQFLLDVIEQRAGKASTIFSSQIPVRSWHELIGESTIADAILDRVVHSSQRIELKGESLRKKQRLNL